MASENRNSNQEKQMIEVHGIKEQRVSELARRRERKTSRKSGSRKAA